MAKPEGTERLAAFTDGVLAISMTLLVLDVRLPEDSTGLADGALWAAIVAIGPRLFGYVLSFLVVATFWISHKNKLRDIPVADGRLVWLNVLFLLLVGFVPFTTQLLADNGGSLATALYAGVMGLASLSLWAMSAYARVAGLEQRPDDGTGWRGFGDQRLWVGVLFFASIPLAYWNADYGKYAWLALVPLGLARRLGGR